MFAIWLASDGYRDFSSKLKNIKIVKIFDMAEMDNLTSEFRLSREGALLKAQLINLTNKNEIDEFTNSLNPSFFAFQPSFFNCACSGSYKVVLVYFDDTEYSFAIAHDKTLKMPNYRDWPLDDKAFFWLKKRGITKALQ